METPGIPSTRWFDATLLPKDQVAQPDTMKAMFIMGHGGNTITRMPEAAKGIEKLDLLVVCDPYPTTWSVLSERKNGTYLLPACTSFEMNGSRTASNRSLQWGEQIVKPVFECKNDYDVMYMLAPQARLRRPDVQEHQGRERRGLGRGHPARDQSRRLVDRLLRPVARAAQSAHEKSVQVRCRHAARAEGRSGSRRRILRPAVAVLGNAGVQAPRHARALQHQSAGEGRRRHVPRALRRRAQTGSACSADGSYSVGSEIKDGYPEFTLGVLKKLGWDKDLTAQEMAIIQRVNSANPDAVSWSIDLSGGIQRVAIEHGCTPYGNGKARMVAWNLPDPIPVHREPIYTPRPDLVAKYPTLPDAQQFRVPNLGFTRAEDGGRQGHRQAVPADPDLRAAGRLRGRRRGDALQQVARRAEARDVRRDQSGGCGRTRHQGRRLGLGHRRRVAIRRRG